jgi:hypothetical protein
MDIHALHRKISDVPFLCPELYVASGLRAPFQVVPGPPSTGREDAFLSGIGLSHHYGVVIWNARQAYRVELRPRDGKREPAARGSANQ